jgi:hypothetical protein
MPTVKQIIEWLDTLPPDAQFVAWWNGREYEINQVGHAEPEFGKGWAKAGVVIGDKIKKRKSDRHLRAVE